MHITQRQARLVIDGAIEQANKLGRKIAVSVVDASGYLVAVERMDGAGFLTPEISEAKAFTAAAWGKPTGDIAERARKKPETYQAFAGIGRTRLVPGEGGWPVEVGGQVVGAVGISGGSGEEDEKMCRAGLESLGKAPG